MKKVSIVYLALAIVLAGALGSAPPQQAHKPAQPAASSSTKPAKACCACCRPTPSPNIPSTRRAASSLTRRPPARCRSTTSPASKARRCSTPPMSPRTPAPNRPLTFVFNGGPGAASAFLHLGLVGPRMLDLGPDGRDAATAQLRDNPDTWLAFTDLVLIDPIGTGWSRTVKPDDAKHFWSIRSDAESFAKAIALYVAKNNRAASPKYLFGESYGGFRAAKVARALQRDQGIVTSGIVMLSPMLEGWLTFGDDESALRAALQLPSLAAAKLERKNAFTPAALADAEKFAMTDYLTTLAGAPPQGDAGKAFYRTRGAIDRPAARRGDAGARLCRERLREKPAAGRQDRQPLRRQFCGRRPLPRTALGARARSDPRRHLARLWRRHGRLRAQRARLQDRDDLCAAVQRRSPAAGTGRAAACRRARRTICARCSPSARRSGC